MSVVIPVEHQILYPEAFALVESFMEKSGIKKFCTEVCHGRCCGACWDSNPRSCHIKGRILGCSVFVCSDLIGAARLGKYSKLMLHCLARLERYVSSIYSPADYHDNVQRYVFDRRGFDQDMPPAAEQETIATRLQEITEQSQAENVDWMSWCRKVS